MAAAVAWHVDFVHLLEAPSLVSVKSDLVSTSQSFYESFKRLSLSSSLESWQLDVARLVALTLFMAVLYANVLYSKKDDTGGKAQGVQQRNNVSISKQNNAVVDKSVFDEFSASSKREPALIVFSGGTAFNNMVKSLATKVSTRVTYVLPISDNGGSSREIIRVLGGPAIGDIRSRLIRLADDSSLENRAIKRLLEYRLNQFDKVTAKEELVNIINGVHGIWNIDKDAVLISGNWSKQSIPEPYKRTLIAFLTHFYQAATVPQVSADGSDDEFDFRGGSIGNFIFTGARLFFQSLEAAILWFSTLSSIPAQSRVCPVMLCNSRVHIAASLVDGSHLVGQDSISHPIMPGGVSTVDKNGAGRTSLPSSVRRVYYLSEKGSELQPHANPAVLRAIAEGEMIIYGMGSLYTSLVPCLIAQGIGRAVREAVCPKLLVLNGSEDRETGGMQLLDYVSAVVAALKQSEGVVAPSSSAGGTNSGRYLTQLGGREVRRYITTVTYIDSDHVRSTLVPPEHLALLTGLGIKAHGVSGAGETEARDLMSGGASVHGAVSSRISSVMMDHNEHYSLGGRSDGSGITAVDTLVVQRYREELPSFVRLTPVNEVSRSALGVLFGSRPSRPSQSSSADSHYAVVDGMISRLCKGACGTESTTAGLALLGSTHYGREALAETIRTIAHRHLAGLDSKRSGFLFF